MIGKNLMLQPKSWMKQQQEGSYSAKWTEVSSFLLLPTYFLTNLYDSTFVDWYETYSMALEKTNWGSSMAPFHTDGREVIALSGHCAPLCGGLMWLMPWVSQSSRYYVHTIARSKHTAPPPFSLLEIATASYLSWWVLLRVRITWTSGEIHIFNRRYNLMWSRVYR